MSLAQSAQRHWPSASGLAFVATGARQRSHAGPRWTQFEQKRRASALGSNSSKV
jgi:hypothetical protein